MVTKFIECPLDDRSWVYVPSLVMICQRAAEILAYFLFGDFTVEFDWLERPNGLEFEQYFIVLYQAWPKDHVCQVLR